MVLFCASPNFWEFLVLSSDLSHMATCIRMVQNRLVMFCLNFRVTWKSSQYYGSLYAQLPDLPTSI